MFFLLTDHATRAVDVCFLIHVKQEDPYVNSSLLYRYLTGGCNIEYYL